MNPFLAKLAARRAIRASKRWVLNPQQYQSSLLKALSLSLARTEFGRLNWIEDKKSLKNFKKNIPISLPHDFESFHQKILAGSKNILWPGERVGLRFQENYPSTPFSHESIKSASVSFLSTFYHFQYFYDLEKVWKHKFLDLSEHASGPEFSLKRKFYDSLPIYFQKKFTELKTSPNLNEISLITGTHSELTRFFEDVSNGFSLKVSECLPQLRWVIQSNHIGEQVAPWKKYLNEHDIPVQHVFSGYGGILAHDDGSGEEGLLLNLNNGFYYEFLHINDASSTNASLLRSITGTEKGEQYMLVLSNNGGLWRVKSGLIVKVVSTKPYRVEPIKYNEE